MEILNQLGELALGSVPTMIFFVLLVAAYGALVRRPLAKTLAERKARTSGAVEQARGAIAAAEAETSVYEDKLRSARGEMAALREQHRQKAQAERDAALGAARRASHDKVLAAKLEIEQSATAALRQIENATDDLSEQILRAVLGAGKISAEVRPS